MAITTTSLGIHKPNSAERVNQGWDAISDVADDVNALIVADRGRLTALEAIGAGARLTALEAATTDTGWVAFTLVAAMAVQAGVAPAVRRFGKVVRMRGLIKSSTGWAPNTAYVLCNGPTFIPAASRPYQSHYAAVIGNSPAANARVSVNSDGSIDFLTGATAPAWVDLSQVSWTVD